MAFLGDALCNIGVSNYGTNISIGQTCHDEGTFSTISLDDSHISMQVEHEIDECFLDPNPEVQEQGERTLYTLSCLEALSASLLSQLVETLTIQEGSIFDDILLELVGRRSQKIRENADRQAMGGSSSHSLRAVRFPRRGSTRARTLAVVFRVADIIHEGLVEGTISTKRDIFYKDVPLFRKQGVVDILVDDLAATFEIERSDLNVQASSKGLFCGSSLTLSLRHGALVEGCDTEGSLIPPDSEIEHIMMRDNVGWILVVEKEAIFQTLCRLAFASDLRLVSPGIIITGKGYPDVATRRLLNKLSGQLPQSIPILALVDADPYGMDILCVYKYGSLSLEHEGQQLAASRLHWIGVRLSELDIGADGLIPLTNHDHKKALSMLSRSEARMPTEWKSELTHMLHTRSKAEIEILYTMLNPATAEYSLTKCGLSERPYSTNFCGGENLANYLVSQINMKLEEDFEDCR